MKTTSKPNQESQEMTRLFHQTKLTLLILSHKDITDESVKSVLSSLVVYKPNHKSPPFSINYLNYVTVSLISVVAAIQDLRYHVNPNNPVMCLRIFMKTHNVDYVKDSYLEGIHSTQDEIADVSLKHRLWFHKLEGARQNQIQQSLVLHCKVLKD